MKVDAEETPELLEEISDLRSDDLRSDDRSGEAIAAEVRVIAEAITQTSATTTALAAASVAAFAQAKKPKASQEAISGKKVFFLYPHSITQGELFDILIMAGFEVYALNDHRRAAKLLAYFPGSIMFINIDEKLEEPEWEAYIRELQENEKTKTARLGILSYNMDPRLVEKYLMDLSLPCGYIQLKLGLQESTRIILEALSVNEAHGLRKHIRVSCENEPRITMNYKAGDKMYYGKLLDISAVGITARITGIEAVKIDTVLYKVQLRLRVSLIMTDVILKGRRGDVCIFLFTNMKTRGKMILHRFIKETIQRNIDNLDLPALE